MKRIISTIMSAVMCISCFTAIFPSETKAATVDNIYTFTTAGSAITSMENLQADSQFGDKWYMSGQTTSGALVGTYGGKTDRTGDTVWGSFKGASSKNMYLTLQPYTKEQAAGKILYYNFDYIVASLTDNIVYGTSHVDATDTSHKEGVSATDLGASTSENSQITIVLDNINYKRYIYNNGELKLTKDTNSVVFDTLAFRSKGNRTYFDNLSYGFIDPTVTGESEIQIGGNATYSVNESDESEVPHPDYTLKLAEETPEGITIENGTVNIAGTVAENTTFVLNAYMGEGTNVVASKKITVVAASKTKENTPDIRIDYEKEKLTGFENGGQYTINDSNITSDGTDINIDTSYFGTTVLIIKKARNDNYADSFAQTLEIPAHPQAPTDYTVIQPTTSEEKGSISGEGLQYSAKSDYTWSDWTVPPSEIAQGTIFKLRKAATNSAFASAETGEITINTIAPIINHTVTFNTDGGSEIQNVTVVDGEKVSKPTDPIKIGYTFVKWQLDGADYDFDTAITGDITLTAIWTKNKCIATFNLSGGNIDGNTENVKVETDYNTVPSTPANPTKTGYTFTGWFPEVAEITENTIYTAQWTAKSYTISKNSPENGSVTLSKTNANMGEKITVTINPSEGYKLASLTVNGETAEPQNNSYTFTMPDDDVKIVAIFERKAVKSINITGPSAVTKEHIGTYTAEVTAEDDTDVTNVYKSNIVWSVTGNSVSDTKIEKDTENGNKAILTLGANEMGTDKKVTVTAVIGEKAGNKEIDIADEPQYRVDITSVKGGTITLTSSDSVVANSIVMFTVAPVSGYALVENSVKVNNGEVNITENNGIYSFIMPAKAVTITAEFTLITYTITKTTSQNGSFVVSAENAETGTTVTISDITPDEGYELDAVTVTKTGDTNTKLTVTDNSFEMPNYHVTVAVTFKKKTYTVTFNVDGQTTEVKVEHGTTAEKKAPQNPTKDGYHFLGWIKGQNADDDVITVWDSITDNGVIYTAKFDENPPVTYTVTITGGEGIENIKLGSTEGQKSGDTYTFTNVLAGTYTFDITYEVGYEKADDSVENITVSENKTSETVSAQKKKFTVTFKVDGQADIEVSNVEYGTAPAGAPNLEDTTERHYLGWVKGTDITSDVINLVDELITENTIYTAKYEQINPQPEKIWLELLPSFNEWLQIEKMIDESKVILSMSKKDNSAFYETDKFSVYVAVYNEDILQSIKKTDFAESENNTLKAIISEPNSGNYKVFIWTSNYEPITEAITSLTMGSNKLF